MEHTGFPSDETLAAFLDGNLDPDTRRRVIEHMTTCEECYSVVAGGGGPIGLQVSSGRARDIASRYQQQKFLGVAASILAVAGLAFMTWQGNRFWVRRVTGSALEAGSDSCP